MPLTSALRRQRKVDVCEFKASMVYMTQFQVIHRGYTEKSCLKKLKIITKKRNKKTKKAFQNTQ